MITQYVRIAYYVCILSLFLPAITVINSLIYLGRIRPTAYELSVSGLFLAGGSIGTWLLRRSFSRLQTIFIDNSVKQTLFFQEHSHRQSVFFIGLSAALSLFLELAIIRYHSCLFPVISFYKNFSLFSCLAGLGAGYALASNKHIPLILTPILLGIQIILLSLLAGMAHHEMLAVLRVEPITTRLSMGLYATLNPFPFIALYLFLFVNFALTALAFLPLGQACGFFLDTIDSLQAYSVNLIGSLVGILCMFVLSAFWMPPVIWFAIVFAALFPFIASGKRPVLIVSATFFFSIVFLGWSQSTHPLAITSPYQQLELRSIGHGQFDLIAAGHYHQRILNLSDESLKNPTERVSIAARNYYDFPYSLAPEAKQIAIVGAGTGNDVAAAIRKSSAHIDAIEIDPAILNFGRLFHPEDPYRNKTVTPVIDDARHFLKTHPDRYDLIIFGLLDSHTLLSHVNNVRLESYVYTVQAFKEARKSLRKGGVLTIAFTVLDPSLGRKIYLMLKEAFDGIPPLCLRAAYDKAIVFVAGKNGPPLLGPTQLAAQHVVDVSKNLADLRTPVDLSTDDWPFFYMPKRVYPISYLPLALIVLVVCFGIGKLCKVEKPNVRQMVFFCLGCGFMLIETKAIAELALFFGNTWHVVGITIAAILVMVFLANYCIRVFGKLPVMFCLILVLISLMAAFFAKDMTIINKGLDPYAKTIIITLPMFFAGLAFSSLLSGAKEFSKLMGANLIGAMIGGLLEYNAMYFGYNALNIFAALLYCGALLFLWLDRPKKLY